MSGQVQVDAVPLEECPEQPDHAGVIAALAARVERVVAEDDLPACGRVRELALEPADLLRVLGSERLAVDREELRVLPRVQWPAERVVAGGHPPARTLLGVVELRLDVAAVVVVAKRRVDRDLERGGGVHLLPLGDPLGIVDRAHAALVEVVAEQDHEVRAVAGSAQRQGVGYLLLAARPGAVVAEGEEAHVGHAGPRRGHGEGDDRVAGRRVQGPDAAAGARGHDHERDEREGGSPQGPVAQGLAPYRRPSGVGCATSSSRSRASADEAMRPIEPQQTRRVNARGRSHRAEDAPSGRTSGPTCHNRCRARSLCPTSAPGTGSCSRPCSAMSEDRPDKGAFRVPVTVIL